MAFTEHYTVFDKTQFNEKQQMSVMFNSLSYGGTLTSIFIHWLSSHDSNICKKKDWKSGVSRLQLHLFCVIKTYWAKTVCAYKPCVQSGEQIKIQYKPV